MAATVRQIAARANVSPSTVSRALNNYPYVDDATRACVLEAARELGYAGAMPRPTERPSCTVHVLVREIGASALVHLTSVNPGMHDDIWRGMHGVFERRGVTPHL